MAYPENVETLARWMHEKFAELGHANGKPWHDLAETSREHYRYVAYALLTSPPECLRKETPTP